MPEEDLCSFVMPYYLKQEAYMRKKLKALQAENAALAQRVQSGREAIASTELCITTAVDKWKVRGGKGGVRTQSDQQRQQHNIWLDELGQLSRQLHRQANI